MTGRKAVGDQVKSIRESLNLTLCEVSNRSGISTEQLSMIESNSFTPSLSHFKQIADALEVRVGTFLDGDMELGPVLHRHAQASQGRIVLANEGMHGFVSLADQKPGRHMDPYVLEVAPETGQSCTKQSHEGEEFIYVIDGRLTLTYGSCEYQLSTGDSIYFDAIVEHQLSSSTESPAKVLAVMYQPI